MKKDSNKDKNKKDESPENKSSGGHLNNENYEDLQTPQTIQEPKKPLNKNIKWLLIAGGLTLLLVAISVIINQDQQNSISSKTKQDIGQEKPASKKKINNLAVKQNLPVYYSLEGNIGRPYATKAGDQSIRLAYLFPSEAFITVTTQPVGTQEELASLKQLASKEVATVGDLATAYLPPREFVNQKTFFVIDNDQEWAGKIIINDQNVNLKVMEVVANGVLLNKVNKDN
jgi:hypothetical protein